MHYSLKSNDFQRINIRIFRLNENLELGLQNQIDTESPNLQYFKHSIESLYLAHR